MSHPASCLAPRGERGIALPVAVLSLVVIGALVAGVFFTARVEQLSARNTVAAAQAQQTAEMGLNATVNTPLTAYASLAAGARSAPQVVTTGSDRYTVTVTKLNAQNKFMVESVGERLTGGVPVASRRVALLARSLQAVIQTPAAALTVRGNVSLAGSSRVDGRDQNPSGWGGRCSGVTLDDAPGVLLSGTYNGGNGPQRAYGDPAVQTSPLSQSDFRNFGPYTLDDLRALANHTLAPSQLGSGSSLQPSVSGGQCNVAAPLNWGEPLSSVPQCQSYYPIIYVTGNVEIRANGRGQGILLVDGDIDFKGNFEFYGIVIATGRVAQSAGTSVVYGTVMAENADLETNALTGNALAQYSSCAIQQALSGTGRLAPLGERAWTQLSDG